MKYIVLENENLENKQPLNFLKNSIGAIEFTNNPFEAKVCNQFFIDNNNWLLEESKIGIAIPITTDAFEAIGFTCNIDFLALTNFLNKK